MNDYEKLSQKIRIEIIKINAFLIQCIDYAEDRRIDLSRDCLNDVRCIVDDLMELYP